MPDRPAEKHAHLEGRSPRPHEEIARLSREHDAAAGGVNPLVAELRGRLAQPLPGIAQIVRQLVRQRCLGGRPAVMCFTRLDPLLAVVALPPRIPVHGSSLSRFLLSSLVTTAI